MLPISRKRRSEREAAAQVYAAARSASRRPAFYLTFRVPDTMQGRFEMVALALFPLLHRLMHDPGDDHDLARLVSESLVDDMDAAFREMGMSDTSVPKEMKRLYRSFAGRIDAYERALGEGEDALAAAVGRNVFPGGDHQREARSLAHYLMDAVAAVGAADLANLRRGDVPYPELTRVAEEGVGT